MIRRDGGRERKMWDGYRGVRGKAECLAETDPSEFRRKWRRSRAEKALKEKQS